MYNIHSHYENILAFANSIIAQPTVVYLHPFGATQPTNIESLQNEGLGPLIICYDQEPLLPFYNTPLFQHITDNFKDDFGVSRSIILLNTEQRSDAKNQILEKFNFVDCNYFFHAFAAADWYRGYQYHAGLTAPAKRKINKKFITFNRITGSARTYRSFFVAELAQYNLLEHGHISYSDVCPEHGHYAENISTAIRKYQLPNEYGTHITSILDSINFPLRIDSAADIPNGSQTLGAIPQLMESFLHVVTETCFWDDRTHLTEKIFKPIVAKQPFALIGCVKNLAYLKSYGFKTFDSWWDESYDNIADPVLRIQAVVKIIKDISSRSNEELEEMLRSMQAILDYNYNWFYSRQFIDTVWKELETNLTSAVEVAYSKSYLQAVRDGHKQINPSCLAKPELLLSHLPSTE